MSVNVQTLEDLVIAVRGEEFVFGSKAMLAENFAKVEGLTPAEQNELCDAVYVLALKHNLLEALIPQSQARLTHDKGEEFVQSLKDTGVTFDLYEKEAHSLAAKIITYDRSTVNAIEHITFITSLTHSLLHSFMMFAPYVEKYFERKPDRSGEKIEPTDQNIQKRVRSAYCQTTDHFSIALPKSYGPGSKYLGLGGPGPVAIKASLYANGLDDSLPALFGAISDLEVACEGLPTELDESVLSEITSFFIFDFKHTFQSDPKVSEKLKGIEYEQEMRGVLNKNQTGVNQVVRLAQKLEQYLADIPAETIAELEKRLDQIPAFKGLLARHREIMASINEDSGKLKVTVTPQVPVRTKAG